STRDTCHVVRVVRGKVARVLGRAAHRELVAVGHAQEDRSSLPQVRDRGGVIRRPEAAKDLRACRGLHAFHAEHVLDRHGNAQWRAAVLAGREPAVGFSSLAASQILCDPEKCLDPGFFTFDGSQVTVEQLSGTHSTTPKCVVQLRNCVYGSASWMARTTK